MRLTTTLLLILCGVAGAVDITVGTDKDHQTIQNAIDVCTGGGSFNVLVDGGTYLEPEYGYLKFDGKNDNCTIVVQPSNEGDTVVVSGSHAGRSVKFDAGLDGADITIKNLSITHQSDCSYLFELKATGSVASNKITIDRCQIVNAAPESDTRGFGQNLASDSDVQLIIKNCTLQTSSSSIAFGHYVAGAGGYIAIENNIINVYRTSADRRYAIQVGGESSDYVNPLGRVIIKGNWVEFTGKTIGHGLLLGPGVDGAIITGNTFVRGNPCIALKGDYAYLNGNVCIATNSPSGQYSITLKGANYSVITNNTFSSTNIFATLSIQDNDIGTTVPATNNKIIGNIISGASYAVYIENDYNDNLLDYNCLYTTGSHIYYISGTSVALSDGIEAIRAAWGNVAGLVANNEDNSIIADPLLDSNYKATALELKSTGSPLLTASDGASLLKNNIGATKFDEGYPIPTGDCINPPFMDSNGDCKVDFVDFTEFALEWMSCGLENQSDCWE